MLYTRNLNWNNLTPREKNGSIIKKIQKLVPVVSSHPKAMENKTVLRGSFVTSPVEDFNYKYWETVINKSLERNINGNTESSGSV